MKHREKGFTTIELLVCFVIVSAISLSMFGIVMKYKERQQVEAIRRDVLAYKYNITKMIQDDIIKRRIKRVGHNAGEGFTFYFEDNTRTALFVDKVNDQPCIKYNRFNQSGGLEYHGDYPLPEIPDLIIEQGTYFTIDSQDNTTFVSIHIPFSHPDLTDKDYGIHIVFPY